MGRRIFLIPACSVILSMMSSITEPLTIEQVLFDLETEQVLPSSRAIAYLLLAVPIQKYECRLPFFQLCDTEMQFVFSFSWTTAAPLMKDAGVLCTHSRTTSGKLQVLS